MPYQLNLSKPHCKGWEEFATCEPRVQSLIDIDLTLPCPLSGVPRACGFCVAFPRESEPVSAKPLHTGQEIAKRPGLHYARNPHHTSKWTTSPPPPQCFPPPKSIISISQKQKSQLFWVESSPFCLICSAWGRRRTVPEQRVLGEASPPSFLLSLLSPALVDWFRLWLLPPLL